jgi:nucleotide-binding universal stress UspA family protein
VLQVIQDPAGAAGFYAQKGKRQKILKSMEEAAEEMMEESLLKMRQVYPDIVPIKKTAKVILVVGAPVTRIVEVAQKKLVGKIIIGSHGRTGLAHLLIG